MGHGAGFPMPNRPDIRRIATYRVSLGSDSARDALRATIVGNRGEPSGESRFSGQHMGKPYLNVEPEMQLLVAITLLLSIAFSEFAMAQQKCIAHTLSPGNDSVAVPGLFFYLKNIGSKPVVIATNDGVIMTLDAGKEMGFVGDNRFDYYVKLVAPADTTTIEFCK